MKFKWCSLCRKRLDDDEDLLITIIKRVWYHYHKECWKQVVEAVKVYQDEQKKGNFADSV